MVKKIDQVMVAGGRVPGEVSFQKTNNNNKKLVEYLMCFLILKRVLHFFQRIWKIISVVFIEN